MQERPGVASANALDNNCCTPHVLRTARLSVEIQFNIFEEQTAIVLIKTKLLETKFYNYTSALSPVKHRRLLLYHRFTAVKLIIVSLSNAYSVGSPMTLGQIKFWLTSAFLLK